MSALGNGVTGDRLLRAWLSRHPASMLIGKSKDETTPAQEATRLRLIDGSRSEATKR